jgi:hypothetical protein
MGHTDSLVLSEGYIFEGRILQNNLNILPFIDNWKLKIFSYVQYIPTESSVLQDITLMLVRVQMILNTAQGFEESEVRFQTKVHLPLVCGRCSCSMQ